MTIIAEKHGHALDNNKARSSYIGTAEEVLSWYQVSGNDQSAMENSFLSLRTIPGISFKWQEPLSSHTTFRIGGAVSCLAEPMGEDALLALMQRIREFALPYFILGGGSNIVAPDDSLHAVSVSLRSCCAYITKSPSGHEGIIIYAGAGLKLSAWLRFCAINGLAGMEFLVGIPGTIGGALVMNAGTREGCIAESLVWIDALDYQGRRFRLHDKDLNPCYRSMGLQRDWIVLGACFHLRQSTSKSVRGSLKEFMMRRKQTQPLGFPSAGCIFKNPAGSSAGALIDGAGLKGFRIGDAEVSEKHANWIINRGSAKARDVCELIRTIQAEVLRIFGIQLQLEIQVLSGTSQHTTG
jgi:UDP-N-acetylmuramate dehydrogenase